MNEIPSDLILLDIEPKKLTSEELETIVYSDWFLVKNNRMGTILTISQSNCPIELDYIEDRGFRLRDCEIIKIENHCKRWSDERFYV